MTSVWVDSSGGMMPLPTVVATAVPESAPTKFSTPAISTARPGESTRVATTVAMALAVSWKPLMKSNTRPRTRISNRSSSSPLKVRSGILQGDIAQDGGHGLGLIGRILEQLVQVVPAHRLDQLGYFSDAVEQGRQGFGEQVVRFVFQSMDLLRRALQTFGLAAVAEQRYRPGNLLGLFEDHLGELACNRRRLIDPIQVDTSGNLF